MIGRRVQVTEDGFLPEEMYPGDYGRVEADGIPDDSPLKDWIAVTPTGEAVQLSPTKYHVSKTGDFAISVREIIITKSWSGWLKGGVWMENVLHE